MAQAPSLYTSLAVGDDPEIRILQATGDDAEPHSPLRYELHIVKLSQCAPFDALSYTWGDPGVTQPILLGGEQVQVTQNLYEALPYLKRLAGGDLSLWVDALCINQADMTEISCQVPLMRQIYSKARKVFVWLGLEGDNSSLALQAIQRWGMKYYEADDSETSIESMLKVVPNPLDLDEWLAIVEVLARPWWKRLWTIQEVCLNQNSDLVCGDCVVPYIYFACAWQAWTGLFEKLEFSSTPTELSDAISTVMHGFPAAKSNFFLQRPTGAGSIIEILAAAARFLCTNPRDQVYGVLGLADARLQVSVDYTKPVHEIYQDFAYAAIQYEKSLAILECAGTKASSIELAKETPSWVPNWNAGKHLPNSGLASQKYNASGHQTARFDFQLAMRTLRTTGVQIGIVDLHSRATGYKPSTQILLFLLQSFRFHYPTGQSSLEALFRMVQQDIDPASLQRFDGYNESFIRLSRIFIIYLLVQFATDEVLQGAFGDAENSADAKSLLYQLGELSYKEQAELLTKLFYPRAETRPDLAFSSFREDLEGFEFYFSAKFGILKRFVAFTTPEGYMGLGPEDTQKGDVVCVLWGCRIPLILRKSGAQYQLVGPCYFHGFMDGQAADEKGEWLSKSSSFDLI